MDVEPRLVDAVDSLTLYAERARLEGLCCVLDCDRARLPHMYRCAEHRREYQRDWYRKSHNSRRGRRRKDVAPYFNLRLAVALEAAYMSGYRHGTGDRAVALADQHRRARAAEAQRTEDGLSFRLTG